MCGRYYYDESMEAELRNVLKAMEKNSSRERHWSQWGRLSRMSGDVHPSEAAPVLIGGPDGVQMQEMNWGYPSPMGNSLIINARAETARMKKLFKRGLEQNRMIIPANGFYEWNRNREKMTFTRHDDPLLFMAGFCDQFDGQYRFTILTTQANESMIGTHDRMPLILERDQLTDWICEETCVDEILQQKPVQLEKWGEYEQLSLFAMDGKKAEK